MSNLLNKAQLFLKRNSATILTGIGAAGVVATSVMAVKVTPKALLILEEAKEEKGEDLTTIEVIKAASPVYIPAFVTGVSTIACIFGANILNKRSQAALVSAYAFLDNSYKEYKNKVTEIYGDEAHDNIREGIAKDKYKDYNDAATDDKQLYFDEYSGRYFQSTPEEVQRAEYELNRTLSINDGVYLNDWYENIDLEPLEHGRDFGWSTGINYEQYWQSWIDFSHTKTVLDDGLECIIISFNQEPVYVHNFEDYF